MGTILDGELQRLMRASVASIQLTRKSNESDRETNKEEQESRVGQKTRAQNEFDVRAQPHCQMAWRLAGRRDVIAKS
jgi:hypothetical protein